MIESSKISTPTTVNAPISLSPPLELRTSNVSKIDYMRSPTSIGDSKIFKTHLLLIKSYSTIVKPSSFSPIGSIKYIITHTPREVKNQKICPLYELGKTKTEFMARILSHTYGPSLVLEYGLLVSHQIFFHSLTHYRKF